MTGIEFAGLVLAVPGLVDVVLRGGDAVYERVETFKTVDKAVNSFREIALDIKQGPLFFGPDALRGASRDRIVPAAIRDQLDRSLAHLESELRISQEGLQNVHEDTLKGKLVYTLWRGKGSHHQLIKLSSSLKASCDKLKDLCLQLHSFRTVQSSHLWTTDTFKLRHEALDNRPGRQLPASAILVAAGNYVDSGDRVEADFILEKKGRENDVRYLCSILSKTALAGREGILPVLGYRQPPYNEPDGTKIFQLLVELPRDIPIESLAYYISSRPCPNISERLQFCCSVARALASVHSLGLVHKSLRSRAILTALNRIDQSSPKVYLQDWTYIREVSGATTQLGEESWQKALYQHPERQGEFAEAAYQAKHDIYSLGINMLEILLWTPFVVPDLVTTSSEPDQVCFVFESIGLRLGEENGGLPDRYRGDPVKLTSRPRATKSIWCEVAASHLDTSDIQRLVLGCLDEEFNDVLEVVAAVEALLAARA